MTPQSTRAKRDIDAAVDWYLAQGGAPLARRFLAAFDAALGVIRDHPGAGSLRYAKDARISNLRVWPLKRFPYLVFYAESPGGIEILRVLHSARDIPETLRD